MSPSQSSGVPVPRRSFAADTGYVLTGFPLTLVVFVPTVALLSAGASLAVLMIGLPILVAAAFLARGAADIERMRLPRIIGAPAPRPRYRRAPAGGSRWRRLIRPLSDGQSWLDITYALFGWIPMTVSFCFVVTWWALTLGGLSYWIWDRYLPRSPDSQDLNVLLGLPDTSTGRILLNLAIGVFCLATLVPVTWMAARVPASFSRMLLTGLAGVRNQIEDLSDQRRAAIEAEAVGLRRLERDIHDGPQQRLVRLAMDLGRARHQANTDPEAVLTTLDEAIEATRETLDELRALSRGIAPPILADRGLPSALAAVAGRSPVPVELNVGNVGRLSPLLENTTYFVVAEALTNVAKHSAATACTVTVDRMAVNRKESRLMIEVYDDGRGGAHVAKGHGLAGLADRVRAAGGTLAVSSPPDGPTRLRAELPATEPPRDVA